MLGTFSCASWPSVCLLWKMSIQIFCPFFDWGYLFKCKAGCYKTITGKQRQNILCINHSKIFFDPPPKVMKIKTKINNWDLIKLKSFYTAKETINKTKRQPLEWEKILAIEATDKGLISKMHKQLLQLTIKRCVLSLKRDNRHRFIGIQSVSICQ